MQKVCTTVADVVHTQLFTKDTLIRTPAANKHSLHRISWCIASLVYKLLTGGALHVPIRGLPIR